MLLPTEPKMLVVSLLLESDTTFMEVSLITVNVAEVTLKDADGNVVSLIVVTILLSYQ